VPFCGPHLGSLFTGFFTAGPVDDEESARRSDTNRFARFHQEMLARGVYLAPSQFEAGFVSLAHTEEEISRTVAAAREAFRGVAT
jgi:glutamate-1-semialdehyde 2,1-aminomutase